MGWIGRTGDWLRAKWPWQEGFEDQPPPASPFSADVAITREDEDLLGRTTFAGELAKLLSRWRADQSLVVALRGGWGEGKSSLKNLILRALEKSDQKVKVVEFNPWRYGDSKAITSAFYGEIGVALGQMPGLQATQRKHAFLTYSRLLSPASEGVKKVGEGLGGAIGTVANLGLITLGAGAVLTALPIAKFAGWIIGFAGILGLVSKALGWLAGKDKPEKPLELVRHDLIRKLKKLPTPVLVIIDDIDRLEPEEVRTVFRHVKANADFPRLTYLLLFQRDIVEKALSEISGGQGRDYLEKIVQAAFDLPTVEPSRISQAFLAALDRVLTGYVNAESGFDQVRFGNVFHGCIRYYLSNLRCVHRLIAALTVHLELHRGSRVLEVNVVDFVAIETLRLFEPEVFAAVATSKDLLTSTRSDGNDRTKGRVRAIIDRATEANRPVVEELLNRLFPPIRWTLGGAHYGDEFIASWQDQRRVCTVSYFDRYFYLRLPDDFISDSEMLEVFDAAKEEASLRDSLTDLSKRNLIGAFFHRLDAMRNKLPLDRIAILLPAMMDAAEPLGTEAAFDLQSPFISAWRSGLWYLRQEPNAEERGRIFLDACKKADALSMPGFLIELDADRRRKPSAENPTILTDPQLAEATSLWMIKFKERCFNLFPLLEDRKFRENLYRWKRLGAGSDADALVSGIAHKPDLLLPLLRAFRTNSASHTVGDRVARNHWRLDVKSLCDFIEFDQLVALARRADRSTFSSDDQTLLDELLAAPRPSSRDAEAMEDDG